MSAERATGRIAPARLALKAVLCLSITWGFVVALVAIIWDRFGDDRWEERLCLMPLVGLLYACLGLVAVHVASLGRLAATAVAGGLGLLTLAAAAWVAVIFDVAGRDGAGHDRMILVAISFTGPVLALIFSAWLMLLPAPMVFVRIAIWLQVTSMTLLAAVGVLLCWTQWWWRFDEIFAIGLTTWFLTVLLGLLALPMLSRLTEQRRPVAKESLPTRITLELTCPRCGVEQTLPTGVTRCVSCHRALVIEVEEPRCECGYLLYRLEGEACPECGRRFPAAD